MFSSLCITGNSSTKRLYTEAYSHVETNTDDVEGYAVVPSPRMLAKLPTSQARTQLPPIEPKPPTPVKQESEEYTVVSPGPTKMVSPVPFSEYNHTVHLPIVVNSQQQTFGQEYSNLNRSDNSLTASTDVHPLPPQGYSAIDVPLVSPPPTGNPTQEAGYGHLSDTNAQQTEAGYELIGDDTRRQPSNGKPKVRARNACQKAKDGQLQTTRERSDFTSYNQDLVVMDSHKQPPPTKPARPPLMYTATDAPGMPQDPAKQQEPTVQRSSLSNEELEIAGYETMNTLFDESEEHSTVPMPRPVISPKVEVDIDVMNQIKTVMDRDSKEKPADEEDSTYGNQLIIEAVHPENTADTDDSRTGLALTSPDMFIVPQHAVAGPLGYCALDIMPPEQHQLFEEEMITPGAGAVEGDIITVRHNSHPNAEGYCDIAVKPAQNSVGKCNEDLCRDVNEGQKSPKKVSGASLVGIQQQLQNDSVVLNTLSHEYELISLSPHKSKLEGSTPPDTKPKSKPKRAQNESEKIDSTTPKETKKSLSKAATVDVPQKPTCRPRRAPPPPPVFKAVDDNVLPSRRDTSPCVSGDIATLPRGKSLLKSPKTPSKNHQQSKTKVLSRKSLPSPKSEGASPKILQRFFAKISSNSSDTTKKNWSKRSFRSNKESPPVSPGSKAKTLPPTNRTRHDQPLPVLDSFDDDDLYSTIQETAQKLLPSPLASATSKPVSA